MAALDYSSLARLVYLDSLTFVYLNSLKGSRGKGRRASEASGASDAEFPKKSKNFLNPPKKNKPCEFSKKKCKIF